MITAELLADGFDRIRETVHGAVRGLTEDQLGYRVGGAANSIAWLVWHLTRVQDDHIAGARQAGQVWIDQGWHARFGLPLDPSDTGYGHGDDQVASVRVAGPALLTDYHDAVHASTVGYLGELREPDLARVVDNAWNPPVTLAVRLVSVLNDDMQHAGQAAFARGLLPAR